MKYSIPDGYEERRMYLQKLGPERAAEALKEERTIYPADAAKTGFMIGIIVLFTGLLGGAAEENPLVFFYPLIGAAIGFALVIVAAILKRW